MRMGCAFALGGIAFCTLALGGSAFYLKDKIHPRPDHAPVTPADFARTIPPGELRADLAAMISMMRHIHPDFDQVTNRSALSTLEASIDERIDHPMNRREFWKEASLINGIIRDGHTGLEKPTEEWNAAKDRTLSLPLMLSFDDEGVRVSRSFDPHVADGVRLRAINGISIVEIRDWITDRISGEGIELRRAYASARFEQYAWLMGLRAPFTLTLADGSRRVLNGIPAAEIEKLGASDPASQYQLSFFDVAAVMRIGTFDGAESDFSKFLADSFATIAVRKTAALIIDLRTNGGGESSQADLLQTYLSPSNLPGLWRVSVKTTPEIKAFYRTLMPPAFRWFPINEVIPDLRGIQHSPDNGVFIFHPDPAFPEKRWRANREVYKGPVYLLIGPQSYSTTAIFVSPLIFWKRAISVGQPTGEPATFFGDNYEFDLPVSKLQASVSHKEFRLLTPGRSDAGLPAQIPIPLQYDALTTTLQILRRNASH